MTVKDAIYMGKLLENLTVYTAFYISCLCVGFNGFSAIHVILNQIIRV